MNPETINAIKEALVPIAEKIGQGAEFWWEVVTRQQYVEGISYLIWAPFIAIIAGICWYVAFNKIEKTDGVSLWAIVPAIVFTVWTMANLDTGIMHLLNPNYYALEFFVNLGTK